MPYDVIDVAKHVINLSNEKKVLISNLKLQKLLYYIQGEFISTFNEVAFKENIVAWKHGPVVEEVYYEYNKYSAKPISEKYDSGELIELPTSELEAIERVMDKYCSLGAWDLVRKTHEEDPWLNSYKEYYNNIITIEELEKFFLN